jgi:hypothetical protein
MWRKFCRETAKLLAGLVAATVAVELLFGFISATPLRWFLPVPPVALYGPDPDTGYRHRANVSGVWLTEHRSLVKTSKLGLRDRDRNLDHDGARRAAVVGDSFAEALQVDNSQTAVSVAEALVSRERPGTEVVNLGLAGARPAVEVARLDSEARRLTPDVAVVLLYVDNLLSPAAMDDSEYTGYRRDTTGEFQLSYGFRNSRGYRFRTSLLGRMYYWLLDHSQVARIINARKNRGFLAEWLDAEAAPAQPTGVAWGCAPTLLNDQLVLWRDRIPAEANALLDAFIRDLAAIRRSRNISIVVAARGIEGRCASLALERSRLIDAMRARIEASGLQFADLDERIVRKVGANDVAKLYGFGANLGTGHPNIEGNRLYGEVFAEIIKSAVPQHP